MFKVLRFIRTAYDSLPYRGSLESLFSKKSYIRAHFSNPRLYKRLLTLARSWSESQGYLQSAELSPFDIAQVYETAYWHDFAEDILRSRKERDLYFQWILRDKNRVEVYTRFPIWARTLLASNLSQRIGRLGGGALQIHEGKEPCLSLLFEGKEVLLKSLDQTVELKHNYRMTLRDVLEVFKKKTYDVGNLEFSQEGIINWNALQLGSWVPAEGTWRRINLDHPDWVNELPAFESLSHEEVLDRYHLDLKEGEWIMAAASTRGNLNLDFNNTHAFLELAIPDAHGRYRVHDFGKFAAEFPKNAIELLKMFCRMSKALVSYPDENIFYTYREQARYPFVLSGYEIKDVLDALKEDITTGWKGNLFYQIQSENCAKWVYFKLVRALNEWAVPDLFRMSLLDTEPDGVIKWIFRSIKLFPRSVQVPILTFLHLPLGAFQETVFEENGQLVVKSLRTHEFFQSGQIFLPALLNHKQRLVERFFEWGSIMPKIVQGAIAGFVKSQVLHIVELMNSTQPIFAELFAERFWMSLPSLSPKLQGYKNR